ncbi:DUF3631 domain-containing protein [Mycobacterium sp. PSTR-4-N]|uniref:DUF3631 domain-containing protein n=1 Tax=Mycobacterium sp. PSTR-4-N TaxID=2917745 RepID=UPI001F154F00|nr:DUF3631 domain-containing protein [Mycobacterium sp. PSTR-4-N]MCG7597840.1 DUF3631 domain-containing protein [Mycobacterium sp. PSTR-4-N]
MTDNLSARGRAIAESGKYQTTILDEVERFTGPFLAFPTPHHLTVIVLWITHTWTTTAFYVTPRLVIDSAEPGSGKTRVLEILALLCRSAKLTLSTTTAALYRRISDAGPESLTVLQDEADALFGKTTNPQAEDLRALYNAGYKRGATVDRCETDGKGGIKVREFPVYAAVALAGLAGKMPATITDRAVVLHMRRRAPDETVREFRERDAALSATPIRDRLEAWAAENLAALEQCRPPMPAGVRDRKAEVWEALLAIADVAGGQWPTRAREACTHFVLQTDPDALSFGLRLLRDVRDAFADNDRMFSEDLVKKLIEDDESEWSNLWGKPIDKNRLAKELKRYGVRSSTLRIGEGRAKGYLVAGEDGLAQAWHRYLPPTGTRDSRASGDIAGQPVTPCHGTRDSRDTGVTPKMASDQHLFSEVTAVTRVTPHPGAPEGPPADRQSFTPPDGPGRCPECGWHIASQGHTPTCPANTEGAA